jgi:DNA mismatch repair protein MutS2
MRNIVSVLEGLAGDSLVLLDELGAGTDPTEGAALAVAILERLRLSGARAAVTTHYAELKIYALSTEGAENASCEFDVETLQPTFRLLTGVPGKSNAFAISRRLGLPVEIIRHAEEILDSEDIRFENVITDLEISKKTAAIERDRAEDYRRQAESLKKDLEAQQKRLAAQREKILGEARAEAGAVLRGAKDEAARLLKEYQRALSENRMKDSEEARRALKEKALAMEEAASPPADRPLKPAHKHLKNGDRVYIHSLGQSGSVISAPDSNGDVMIQAGLLKVKANLAGLSLDLSEKAKPKPQPSAARPSLGKSASISPELDLRGLTADEASMKADKYLDDAYLAGLAQVSIIHGKGTGALRSAIHSMLKGRGRVADYRLGRYGEGEDGVTIVRLSQS